MKTLLSALGGALVITEDAGVISISIDESIGGGKAAGILSGQAKINISGLAALKLGESELNAKLPVAAEPIAEAAEAVVNAAIQAVE